MRPRPEMRARWRGWWVRKLLGMTAWLMGLTTETSDAALWIKAERLAAAIKQPKVCDAEAVNACRTLCRALRDIRLISK